MQPDATLLVSMSMMPKLMHLDYASAFGNKPSCDLGRFTTASGAYELYGEDGPGRQRKAIPAKKGDPVVVVVPVTDLMKALAAAKQGGSAGAEGYLLATVTRKDVTGWRFYTGMPDRAVLEHDMVEVLDGGATPIFRNGADNKTQIFMPGK